MEYDERLGPLRFLVGAWTGEGGTDLAPSDEAATMREPKTSDYREEMLFEETGQVDNHEQTLFGLRYRTTAWRIGHDDPFHEEVGYWMWDAASGMVIRSFMPPRGMAVLAGGKAGPDDSGFELEAKVGAEVYGISSTPFLDEEFKTVRYTFELRMLDEHRFKYTSHTYLKMKGRDELFDHLDENTMVRKQ